MSDAPQGRPHGVSGVYTYEECPRRYLYKYVDKKPQPPRTIPHHWRMGSVVHAGLEGGLEHARVNGLPIDEPSCLEAARASLTKSWQEQEMPPPPAHGEWDRAVDLTFSCLQEWPLHGQQIVAVEHKLDVTSDAGVRVLGYGDLFAAPEPRTLEVVDHKITTRIAGETALAGDFQLNLYAWAALRTWPQFDTVLLTHNYPPAHRRVTVESTPGAREAAIARVEAVAEMIDAEPKKTDPLHQEEGWRPRPGEWCAACPFQSICPAFGGAPT